MKNKRTQWLSDLGQQFLSVGVVSADWSALTTSLEPLDKCRDWLHLDIMDGQFCPGFTVGPWCIKHLPKDFVIDVHLMTDKTLDYAMQCADLGAHVISFQYEACTHIHHILKALSDKEVDFTNKKVPVIRGITLCPGTPISVIEPIIHELEMVQLLAVDPGYGTRLEDAALLAKILEVHKLAREKQVDIMLSIDGSLTLPLAEKALQTGANIVVSGSAIFKSGQTNDNLIKWHSILMTNI